MYLHIMTNIIITWSQDHSLTLHERPVKWEELRESTWHEKFSCERVYLALILTLGFPPMITTPPSPLSGEMVYLASHKPPQQPVLSLFSGTRGTPAAAVVVPFRVGLFSSFTLTLTFPRPCFAPSSPFETWLGGNCWLQGSVFPGSKMYVECWYMFAHETGTEIHFHIKKDFVSNLGNW